MSLVCHDEDLAEKLRTHQISLWIAPFWLLLGLSGPGASLALAAPSELHDVPSSQISQATYFAAGAGSAFVAHELGHVVMNLAFGNVPYISGFYSFKIIPFFAIEPRIYCENQRCERHDGRIFSPGRSGKYAIVTAGFDVQHITSEIILTQTPQLRKRSAPFQKGWLAFNVVLSLGYALTSVLKIEDAHGDASGASDLARLSPWAFAPFLIVPAALDTYRYFAPQNRLLPWVSRGAKVSMLGVSFAL